MLKVQNLHKSYAHIPILQDLSFQVQRGEVYGLLGPNGAGKTTTINAICYLVQMDRGTILINDRPVDHHSKSWLGIVPQENWLYPHLSSQENLNFYAKIYGLRGKLRRERLKASLEAVNLHDRADHLVATLSGGEKRRLNIAIALVHQPQLLILDEPTTGLDIESRYQVWDLIHLLQSQGLTILLTTHLFDEAERLSDRLGILSQGKIVAEGTLEELRQQVKAKEIALIQTPDPQAAIARAISLNLPYRRYGEEIALWLPESWELGEIADRFHGLSLTSLRRQTVGLEHIYLEVTHR